jgi:hypothetical protein
MRWNTSKKMTGDWQETGEKMYNHKTGKIRGNGQNYLLRNFFYYLHSSQMLLGHTKSLGYVAHMIKGKAIPLQAWTGPEGSRKLRLPDFKTVSTWRCYGCQPYAPAAFIPRNYSWYSFLLEGVAHMMDTRNMNRISHRILILKGMQGLSFISELRTVHLLHRRPRSASIYHDTSSAQVTDKQNTHSHR